MILDRYLVVARALASLGHQRHHDQQRQRRQRLPDDRRIAQEAALADALRPYGIRLSLSINYTAPTDSRFAPDTLTNAQLDPHGAAFRGWWNRKATQIQASIPDFIGFTVKANSEGQPGPQDFGYDHGDGANGIAAAVAPLGMKVFWRTFVYNADVDEDRLKRAYLEFGPIDDELQPDGSRALRRQRAPADQERAAGLPGAGALPPDVRPDGEHQPGAGAGGHAGVHRPEHHARLPRPDVGGGPQDRHVCDRRGGTLLPKRLVGNIVDGTAQGHSDTAIVGVANLGNADNLTGHHFAPGEPVRVRPPGVGLDAGSEDIADDWTRMTWSNDPTVVDTIVQMMMGSCEALASYQTPLGIAHQFRSSVHYGPDPAEWVTAGRLEPGLLQQGRQRRAGLRPLAHRQQLRRPVLPDRSQQRYGNIATTPENLLMWFHHVPWGHPMDRRPAVLGRARLPLPDGRPVRDLDARDLGLAAAAHRRPPVRGGQGQARGRTRPTPRAGATPA